MDRKSTEGREGREAAGKGHQISDSLTVILAHGREGKRKTTDYLLGLGLGLGLWVKGCLVSEFLVAEEPLPHSKGQANTHIAITFHIIASNLFCFLL